MGGACVGGGRVEVRTTVGGVFRSGGECKCGLGWKRWRGRRSYWWWCGGGDGDIGARGGD